MAGKFYVDTIGKYDTVFDTFVDAEASAKKRAHHSENVFILQQLAQVEMPTKDAVTTVL